MLAASIGLVLVIIIHPGSPEIKAVVGSGNQAERKIDIMDNFLDLGRSLVPDNLFQVIMVMRSKVLRQKMFAK